MEKQNQHNADNTAKPSVITNPMVTGNNNNENNFLSEPINKDSNSVFSELIINENQSLVSEKLREDDMAANVKKSERDNSNNESFISDQAKDPDIVENTKQNKKNRKKKNSKVNISDNYKHQCEYDTIEYHKRTVAVIKAQ